MYSSAERLPEAEHLLVAQQHVAARLQVVVLPDAGAGDRLAERHAVALLHEGDIVDDEDARFADPAQILDRALRADQTVAAAVERPGAAERAIPWAAARELDRGARVEHADESICGGGAADRAPASARRANGQSRAAGPRPPRSRRRARRPDRSPASIAASSGGIAASPSPFSTQSIAPAPCSSSAAATNEALCPPTQMKISGKRAFVAFARSTISGHIGEIVARERDGIRPPTARPAGKRRGGSRPAGRSAAPRARPAAPPPRPARARAAPGAGRSSCTSAGRDGPREAASHAPSCSR